MKRVNFRIAECLVDGKRGRYAIMEDGKRVRLEKDNSGNEYFRIENPYARVKEGKSLASYKERNFYNLIRDAITAIREDYADSILCKEQNVGGFINVVRFVDEKIGKEYREKTLAGWANTKFGYALRAGSKNSWSGYAMIGSKGEKLSVLANALKYRVFETEEEALNYGKELLDLAREYASRMVSAENHKEAINECFDEVNEKYGKFSIIEDFMADLVTGNADAYKNENHELTDYGYDTMQCVIPVREDIIENEWKAQAWFLWPGLKYHFEKFFENWESKDIETIISTAFADFYKNNQNPDSHSCETGIVVPEEVKENLFERWLKCVEDNKELLYPVA